MHSRKTMMKEKYFYHEHLADYAELKAKGRAKRANFTGIPMTSVPLKIYV